MQLHIAKTKNELVTTFADWLVARIEKVLTVENRCVIALSGGSTPTDLFKLLAESPYKEKIDWTKLHIFWGDERDVPYEDERNNAKVATDVLLSKVGIPENQIHIMDTRLASEEAAENYEQILYQYFAGRAYSFDIVMLGMGDDAHTLSLFPGKAVINENHKWVVAFYLEEQKMNRITLTAPVVNNADAVCFLVAGKSKAPALKEVLYGEKNVMKYPSQRIQPVNGELHWFVDKDATELLP